MAFVVCPSEFVVRPALVVCRRAFVVCPSRAVLKGKRKKGIGNTKRNEPSRKRYLLDGQNMDKTQNHRSIIEQWPAVGGGWWLVAVGGGRWWSLGAISKLVRSLGKISCAAACCGMLRHAAAALACLYLKGPQHSLRLAHCEEPQPSKLRPKLQPKYLCTPSTKVLRVELVKLNCQ